MIHGINTFLPVVKKASESKPTSIVITGSKQGITNPPGNPAYNASKAAVKSLAEQLSYDLRESSTSVHLLVPGWTFTNLVSYLLCISLYQWQPEGLIIECDTTRPALFISRRSPLELGCQSKSPTTCIARWSKTSSMSSAPTTT